MVSSEGCITPPSRLQIVKASYSHRFKFSVVPTKHADSGGMEPSPGTRQERESVALGEPGAPAGHLVGAGPTRAQAWDWWVCVLSPSAVSSSL